MNSNILILHQESETVQLSTASHNSKQSPRMRGGYVLGRNVIPKHSNHDPFFKPINWFLYVTL